MRRQPLQALLQCQTLILKDIENISWWRVYQKIFSGMKNLVKYKYKSNLQRKNILPNKAKIMENSR